MADHSSRAPVSFPVHCHLITRGKLLEPINANQIRKAFGGARAAELSLPDLAPVDWGVLDYFGWIHTSGHLGFVVMPVENELRGLRLRRMLSNEGRPRTHMCSWCHHVYRSRGTAMFSAEVAGSEGRRTIGNYICRNLDCSVRIRNLTSDPPTYMPETIELERKVLRLRHAVIGFMARANRLEDMI